MKKLTTDKFADDYLLSDKEHVPYFESTRRVLAGIGTREDIEMMSRARFIMGKVYH